MQQHLLGFTEGVQLRQHPLGLAEGVAEQDRRPLRRPLPPATDLLGHDVAGGPAVDRQSEGGLADQHVGSHPLEGGAAGIGVPLEVAAHQPALPAGLQQDLGRTQHVAGTVERHGAIAEAQVLAVADGAQIDAGPQAPAQDAFRRCRSPSRCRSRAGHGRRGRG